MARGRTGKGNSALIVANQWPEKRDFETRMCLCLLSLQLSLSLSTVSKL